MGGLHIEAIHVPGHTPGGYAFLDIENRCLYNGDSILRHASILHSGGCTLNIFINGLEKLWTQRDRFDLTIANHGHRIEGFKPLPTIFIKKLIQCAQAIDVSQSVEKKEFDGEGLEYTCRDEGISIAFKLEQL